MISVHDKKSRIAVHQLIHNFVRPHWTTGNVPAIALGILKDALCLEDILTGRFA